MSYNIDNSNGFVSVKLTNIGRQMLASGQLTFNQWALGDSEINYDREEVVETNSTDVAFSANTKILRPKDKQPNIKYFVSTGSTVFNPITNANINVVKALVNNKATERGFFSGTTGSYNTLTTSEYVKLTGTVTEAEIDGTDTIDLGSTGSTVGDKLLVVVSNGTLGDITGNTNNTPAPYLWYDVQDLTGTTVELDRNLPDISAGGSVNITYYVYSGGEVKDAFGTGNTASYWDTGTLSFSTGCDVTNDDVPVWNMNNVWSEDIYVGTKDPYLGFDLDSDSTNALAQVCEGVSNLDGVRKAISVLHYTNNTISNLYGESFYIDATTNKLLRVDLPTLMYHRYSGSTASGVTQGMSFVSDTVLKFEPTTDIEYYDLLEDSTLISSGRTANVVGRVYPQLKVVIFTDDEIVATMSYKSNRNWTLPALDAVLAPPAGGIGSGVLAKDEVMYLTYVLETTSGLTNSIPCQSYVKVENTSNASKDVDFNISDVDLLPYMRKIESGWDGKGFYAHNFKLLYQIVPNSSTRPSSDAWKEVDFTSTSITSGAGETIDPTLLETQNPALIGFKLDSTKVATAVDYELNTKLNLPDINSPEKLQFGDERFLYGNIDTYIGATIYKTIFLININANQFIQTTNPTKVNTTNIRVSEVGIYDNNNNLVLIGKLSRPVELVSGRTITMELSIDF
jgi:hypothetical protein